MNVIENAETVNKINRAHWDRIEITDKIQAYRELEMLDLSQREIVKKIGAPRSTLKGWLQNYQTLDEDSEVISFFESSKGLKILHRITTGLHFVFAECGACGVSLISKFLELSKLDKFIASSESSQRKLNIQLEEAIVEYGNEETILLGEFQPKKDITIVQDETFTGGLTLLTMDAKSGFILLEEKSESRDAEAWNSNMAKAMEQIPSVNIVQSTSDEGTGILSYVENYLSAHHSPDLFHVQQDLSRAVSAAIASKLRGAEKSLAKLLEKIQKINNKKQKKIVEGKSDLVEKYDAEITELNKHYIEVEKRITYLKIKKEEIRSAIKGIGEIYHPINFEKGTMVESLEIGILIEGKIELIRKIAKEENLREASFDLLDKASRVVPKMVSTIEFFSTYVKKEIEKLGLDDTESIAIYKSLIPALYYERLSKQESKKEQERTDLKNKSEEMKNKIFTLGGELENLTINQKEEAEKTCANLVNIFQRSSSCVEGRNGVLSFRHHELHNITDRKRKVLTIIHNFFIQRSDGTTAAERFFEKKPRSK